MAKREDVLIELRMSKAQARAFVDGLTHDDFRKRLEHNPAEVLAEHGIELAPELIPDRVKLPQRKELEHLVGRIPGGQGFRTEDGEGFFHPLMVLIGTLANDP
jgi:hypothetical protein